MSYQSIDTLQKVLSETVFTHTKDAKKAAGRALGTLIEIITYYLLNEWNFSKSIAIERGIEEYGNSEITHNVEFSMHPIISEKNVYVEYEDKISVKKIAKKLDLGEDYKTKSNYLIEERTIIKNACVVAENNSQIVLAFLNNDSLKENNIKIVHLLKQPFAMFECKRVGVEEGAKKGPQTIEKAKQGAYTAITTSSLQKIRGERGEMLGLIYENGKPTIKPYFELLNDIVYLRDKIPENFILSVGVVSNHGNWFTSDNPNKELKVLAQSYDWLLFLSDSGLAQFISDLLLNPDEKYIPIQKAFYESYKEGKKCNVFTKVRMNLDAHIALTEYFHLNIQEICNWFNIISPNNKTIENLKNDLISLIKKSC